MNRSRRALKLFEILKFLEFSNNSVNFNIQYWWLSWIFKVNYLPNRGRCVIDNHQKVVNIELNYSTKS